MAGREGGVTGRKGVERDYAMGLSVPGAVSMTQLTLLSGQFILLSQPDAVLEHTESTVLSYHSFTFI